MSPNNPLTAMDNDYSNPIGQLGCFFHQSIPSSSASWKCSHRSVVRRMKERCIGNHMRRIDGWGCAGRRKRRRPVPLRRGRAPPKRDRGSTIMLVWSYGAVASASPMLSLCRASFRVWSFKALGSWRVDLPWWLGSKSLLSDGDREEETTVWGAMGVMRGVHSITVFHCAVMENVRSTVGKFAKKWLTNERYFPSYLGKHRFPQYISA